MPVIGPVTFTGLLKSKLVVACVYNIVAAAPSIVIPPPLFADAFPPFPKVIFLSTTSKVVEFTVVVVPSTWRFPAMTTVPVLSPTVAGSIVNDAGPLIEPVVVMLPIVNAPLPNCVSVIEPSAMCLASTEFCAIFAEVTWLVPNLAVVICASAIWLVSILPSTSSLESTEFAPSCVAVILPSGI